MALEPYMTTAGDIEIKVSDLLEHMTLEEKIGQLCLVNSVVDHTTPDFKQALVAGRVGAILNQVDREVNDDLQRIAIEESRLGIPLLIGRDVIHGFKTIFPIPLGQAATWNPQLVERAARIAAQEAAETGVNWTYAPMLDVARDPRWGRVAESFGEDPYLISTLGAAMVRGLQGDDLSQPGHIAACAKHFAGYGASESGRDYNTTNVPENELRNVHLPPFRAAIDAGVVSLMTSFSDLDGVPASANRFLLRQILRDEWGFTGFVVSDWDSIVQLRVHGLTATDKDSAREAANAGVDMEMSSQTYAEHLGELIEEGKVSQERVDAMVANILRVKFRLGLFDEPRSDRTAGRPEPQSVRLADAKEAATQSVVLLTNKKQRLPLTIDALTSIAVLGPLANDGYEQLGTWIFDGDPGLSQTPLQALRAYVNDSIEIHYHPAMESTRTTSREYFAEAKKLAEQSDVAILFLGEESILAGEAHCRADISLPGNQEALIAEIASTGTPIILVLMTGRPLALQNVVDKVDALVCAWHAGSMAGPAIVDLLFGKEAPSGKLPVTFPRVTGQIPIYYSHKNTGRPPTRETVIRMEEIERGAPQHSVGNTSFHLDTDYAPLFPFGYGLSYVEFRYTNIRVSSREIAPGGTFTISADVTNIGDMAATEVVQLYIRDLVGSVTRPVRELKGFERCRLEPGETLTVSFEMHTSDLAFHGRSQRLATEPGQFHAWIGGSSETDLRTEFELVER